MGFKQQVNNDNSIFLNSDEFADLHTVRYDGEEFESIPVVLEELKETERNAVSSDHAEGIYRVSAKAFLAQRDIGGAFPGRSPHGERTISQVIFQLYFNYTVTSSFDFFKAVPANT